MQDSKFKFNDRVEFKDNKDLFHVGYVKKVARHRRGLFGHKWMYSICEYVKGATSRRVYVVSEDDIFGIVEKREQSINVKEHKTYKDFKDLEELK